MQKEGNKIQMELWLSESPLKWLEMHLKLTWYGET